MGGRMRAALRQAVTGQVTGKLESKLLLTSSLPVGVMLLQDLRKPDSC